MTRTMKYKVFLATLSAALMLLLVPLQAEAGPDGWLDKLAGFVLIQKGIEQEGNFDSYIEQIAVMRSVFKKEWEQGDLRGTYAVMDRLMEMLQAREGGIRAEAAMAFWDYCYQVTPVALHNENRHPRALAFPVSEKPRT